MFVWVVPVLASLCALLWAPTAYACKCAGESSPSEARDAAAAVFEGRVTQITPPGPSSHDVVVELSVTRTWKEVGVEKVRVRTHAEGPACGFAFEQDQTYLVYAQKAQAAGDEPTLSVSRCSRTRLMTEAEPDLAELGMGVVPVAPYAQGAVTPVDTQRARPAAGGCASCSLGLPKQSGLPATSTLVMGLALLLALRRRRPR